MICIKHSLPVAFGEAVGIYTGHTVLHVLRVCQLEYQQIALLQVAANDEL